jgi:hypothetical protein
LAVAVATLLRHDGSEPTTILPAIKAFHAVRPLSPAEADALWPLVVLRSAGLVVSGNHQSSIDADNDYANSALDLEWRIFERANAIPIAVITAQIRHALGVAHPADPVGGRLVAGDGGGAAQIVVLDLSVDADGMDSGAWLDPDCESRLAAGALAAGAAAVTTAFGQARLTRSATLSATSPAAVATGVHVWPGPPLMLVAPWAGTVTADDGAVTLTGAGGTLELRGAVRAAAGTHGAEAGAALAVVAGPTSLGANVTTIGEQSFAERFAQLIAEPRAQRHAEAHLGSLEQRTRYVAGEHATQRLLALRAKAHGVSMGEFSTEKKNLC